MKIAHFDYGGTPARLFLDRDGRPERCELYDRATDGFVLRDDLTVDIWSGSGSRLIGEDEFARLLAKVRAKSG